MKSEFLRKNIRKLYNLLLANTSQIVISKSKEPVFKLVKINKPSAFHKALVSYTVSVTSKILDLFIDLQEILLGLVE